MDGGDGFTGLIPVSTRVYGVWETKPKAKFTILQTASWDRKLTSFVCLRSQASSQDGDRSPWYLKHRLCAGIHRGSRGWTVRIRVSSFAFLVPLIFVGPERNASDRT